MISSPELSPPQQTSNPPTHLPTNRIPSAAATATAATVVPPLSREVQHPSVVQEPFPRVPRGGLQTTPHPPCPAHAGAPGRQRLSLEQLPERLEGPPETRHRRRRFALQADGFGSSGPTGADLAAADAAAAAVGGEGGVSLDRNPAPPWTCSLFVDRRGRGEWGGRVTGELWACPLFSTFLGSFSPSPGRETNRQGSPPPLKRNARSTILIGLSSHSRYMRNAFHRDPFETEGRSSFIPATAPVARSHKVHVLHRPYIVFPRQGLPPAFMSLRHSPLRSRPR